MLLTRVKQVSTKGSHTFVSWQFYLQKTINVLSEYDKNAVTVGGSTWKSYYVSDRDWRVLDLLRHPYFFYFAQLRAYLQYTILCGSLYN